MTLCHLLSLSVFKNIARLAVESFANFVKGLDFNCFRFSVFENRNVCHSYSHTLRKLGNAHFSLGKHNVDVNYNHAFTSYRKLVFFLQFGGVANELRKPHRRNKNSYADKNNYA